MDTGTHENHVLDAYHTGLRDMHALEMTAIELTSRQVERLQHYPEMKARLEQHHGESEEQARRLDRIMEEKATSSSAVKNTVSTVMGNVAAALHAPATDEILKNTFANFAFEHQEIAAYTSLIAMAEVIGDTAAIPLLQQSLAEEQAMAEWIARQIVPTTQRFLALTREGKIASA